MKRRSRWSAIFALAASVTALCGCLVIPVAHKPTSVGPSGMIEIPQPEFIQPGVTTRAEVAAKLSSIEVQTGIANHFWGRWTYQKWTVYAVAAAPGGAGGGSMDLRHTNNLLIDFDDKGIVQRAHREADRALLRELSAWARETKTEPEPSEISARHLHDVMNMSDESVLKLYGDTLELVCQGQKKHQMTASVKDMKLAHLMREQKGAADSQAGRFLVTLKFAKKTRMGRRILLDVNAVDLYRLIEFTEHYSQAKKS